MPISRTSWFPEELPPSGPPEEVSDEGSPPSAPTRPAGTIYMHKGRDILLSPLLAVQYFEAQGKYTRVVLREEEGLLQMALQAVEGRLPTGCFLRIHRSVIVNISCVHVVRRNEWGRLDVFMRGRPEALRIARPYEILFKAGIS